jgi:hypothetical protein
MQLGSVGLKSIIHVKDRWKDLVFHVDKTKRLFGFLCTSGCHKCDCIAYIADFTVENAKYPRCTSLPIGDVFPRKYRLNALQSSRFATVDPFYDRVGVRAAEYFCVEEIGKFDLFVVVKELSCSRDNVNGIFSR